MSKTIFSGNTNNQYDLGTIAKEVSDFYGQSIRITDTNSVIKNFFTHFRTTYDVSNKPTEVIYYRGTKSHTTTFDVLSSPFLATGYFEIRSAPDNQLWVVWFNVDENSTQPVVSGAKYIEIKISSTDTAQVIAFAISLNINSFFKDYFIASRNGIRVEIKTTELGLVDDSNEAMTPFTFTQVSGTQEIVQKIELSYVGADPVYEGQLLKGYSYDIYSGKFLPKLELNVENIDINLDSSTSSVSIGDFDGDKLEINPDGSINVNVVQTDQILKSYFNEISGVVTGVTEELVSYIAASDVYLQKIEFSGTNIAQFELVINGITQDKKRTFFNGNLENVFNFDAGLNVDSGSTIKVYVVHDRPDPGDFNSRLQILE